MQGGSSQLDARPVGALPDGAWPAGVVAWIRPFFFLDCQIATNNVLVLLLIFFCLIFDSTAMLDFAMPFFFFFFRMPNMPVFSMMLSLNLICHAGSC